MKKLLLLILIGAGTVWFYYWYVRGVNLLLSQDDTSSGSVYSFAVRLPPKPNGTNGKTPAKGAAPATEFSWETAEPMPTARNGAGAAAIGNVIYVVGGTDGFASDLKTVESFDAVKNKWTTLQPMPKGLSRPAVGSDGQKLYVFGGFTSIAQNPLDSTYVYDPALNRWTQGRDIPEPIGGEAIVAVDGMFHLLGGKGLGQSTQSHFIYDPKNDAWTTGEPLVSGRDALAAGVVDGRIYVIGGKAGEVLYNLDTVEALDSAGRTWEQRQSLPTKRSDLGGAVIDGKIYVMGGVSATDTFAEAYEYDPKADHWRAIAPMPTARQGIAVASIGEQVFVIGGGRRPGLSVSDVNEVMTPRATDATPAPAAPAKPAPTTGKKK